MSAPSFSIVGDSAALVSVPTRPSGTHSGSPLQVETGSRGGGYDNGSIGAGSAWRAPGEPGSPNDDSRSVASSVRSVRRRRGGPEPAASTGEAREWSQTFMDLERMQRENKERMYGSVRSGRSSPGDDQFVRSGSTSSAFSSVRRRRWHAASGNSNNSSNNNGGGVEGGVKGAAAGDDGMLGSVPGKSPLLSAEAAPPQPDSAVVPRLISTANAESPETAEASTATATTAARESSTTVRAGSPFSVSTFSPREGDEVDAHAGAQPRLSGLPMWLKRRSTANARPTALSANAGDGAPTENAAEPSAQHHNGTHTTAAEVSSNGRAASAPAVEGGGPADAAENKEKVALSHNCGSNPASPTRKARSVTNPSTQPGGPLRRSPMPAAPRDVIEASYFTSSGVRSYPSTAASASPLTQTYLARHSRAAGAFLVVAGTATSTKREKHIDTEAEVHDNSTSAASAAVAGVAASPSESITDGGVVPVAHNDAVPAATNAESAEGTEETPSTDAPPAAPPAPSPPPSTNTSAQEAADAAAAVQVESMQLPTTLAVDDGHESTAADVTGGQSTVQTSLTVFSPVKVITMHGKNGAAAAGRRNSDDTSVSTSGEPKAKRPARVVRQVSSPKKRAVVHNSVTAASTDASPLRHSASRDRPSASVSHDRPSISVSRARSFAAGAAHESSLPRSSHTRHTLSRQRSDTAESSLTRASGERSMAERPRDTPSGHLQRSTTLFELRRKQVLLDRQERERKAAAEEQARVSFRAQAARTKKKVLTTTKTMSTTTGAAEVRAGTPAGPAAAATTAAAAREKGVRTGVSVEEGRAANLVRRHSSTSSAPATATTTDANGRSRFAAAAALNEQRTAVCAKTANASTTTARVATTAVATPSPAAVADTLSSTARSSASAVAAAETATATTASTAATPPPPSPAFHPTAASVAPHHTTAVTATGSSTTLVHARKPIIDTASLAPASASAAAADGAAAPPATPASSAAISSTAAGTPVGATAAARPTPAVSALQSGGPHSRAGTRALSAHSLATALPAEAMSPTAKGGKVSPSPTVTAAQLHRAGISTRREATNSGAATTSGIRRTERRGSAHLVTLATLTSATAKASAKDKAAKVSVTNEENSTSAPVPSAAQEVAAAAPAVASPTAVETAVETIVDASPSASPTPTPPELRPAPFCVECGQRHVDDTAKFCAVCGHKRVFV
ncbi:hypothetical protein NQL31_007308 [Lotmaria passim]